MALPRPAIGNADILGRDLSAVVAKCQWPVYERKCGSFPLGSTVRSARCATRIDKLGLTAEHHLLEIGQAGAGRGPRRRARGLRGDDRDDLCRATARRGRRSRIAAESVDDRVTLLDADWRDVSGVHDRVISIEMIEAVDWRDYDDFFATIERCLAPDGLVAIQAICAPDARWGAPRTSVTSSSTSCFPTAAWRRSARLATLFARATSMRVVGIEDFGSHYAETLLRWRQRFVSRIEDAKALGLDARFCRLWEFYLASCEAAFRERYCTVVQIVIAGAGSPLHPSTGLAS